MCSSISKKNEELNAEEVTYLIHVAIDDQNRLYGEKEQTFMTKEEAQEFFGKLGREIWMIIPTHP